MQQKLPERFSMTTLEKNLAALMPVNEDLVRRICLPVDGTHIHFLQGGEARYQRHRTLLPFVVGKEDFLSTLGDANIGENIFLFGIGLGEQLDYLLEHFKEAGITVWDRDPWLVRLVLMQRDYSQYIGSGQLQLHMCADLFGMLDTVKSASVICHPFLRSVYENEYKLVEDGVGKKRAIICSGDLFVDDVGKILRGFGYSLYTLEIKKLALEEIETAIQRFDPNMIIAINYTNGLAEMCHSQGVDLICWEVDPAADRLKPCNAPTDRAFIFTYRKANVRAFIQAGFKNVEYLPLASNIEKRFPAELSLKEKESYGSSLSFVGSSMIEQAKSFRDIFLSHYKAYCGGSPNAVEEGNRLLEEILSVQRQDLSTYRIPDLLSQYFSDFISYLFNLPGAHNPFMLVGEIAAAEKRINYIASLGRLGLNVWGDQGWRITEQYGVKYMGSAGHTYEINKIYSASLVNVDINRLYQADIVTMRVFDIMACGGFVLAEYSRDLDELFEIGKEVEAYHTLDELLSKASYYLDHRGEALEIAERGREAVRNNHTIEKRVKYMLSVAMNNQ